MDYKNGVPMDPRSPDHARDDMPDWFLKELDQREKDHEAQTSGAACALIEGFQEIRKEAGKHNCYYCGHFNRENDTCRVAKPPSRPPTFIIVHGCKQFWPEDDIPF